MNLSTASTILAMTALASNASAFTPFASYAKATALRMGSPGMDLSGNSWQPDSEKMGVSTVDDILGQKCWVELSWG